MLTDPTTSDGLGVLLGVARRDRPAVHRSYAGLAAWLASGSRFHVASLIVAVFVRVLVLATVGLCSCASISGLESYTSSPSEGVDAGAAGNAGESADGAVVGDGASNEGIEVRDGNGDSSGLCANPCNGACVDFASDNSNCGGCGDGFTCTSDATCQNGACLGGRSDASTDTGLDAGQDAESEGGHDAGCTNVDLPPSVNVDAAQWNFATSPTWTCTNSATTTITASASGASLGGDDCGGSATLVDINNDLAQTTGGPNVLVIRLNGLTVAGGHVLELAGNESVIFLVNGNVTIDSGGTIDASANGTTAGPGGDSSACASSTGTSSNATPTGGGGGSFGTSGGYGTTSSGNSGSGAGAVAASLTLQPLRGGCAGGTGGGSTNNPGGAGGGGFEISASGLISVGATGAAYLSAGGGYSPGASTSVKSNGSGGAGSGGGILLASPVAATFANGSVVRVHGGGAGSSRGVSSNVNAGENGHTTDNTEASGGAMPDVGGAAGGAGGLCAGTGTTCTISAVGSNGTHTTVSPPDGSGGGGGGGSIRVTSAPVTLSCN